MTGLKPDNLAILRNGSHLFVAKIVARTLRIVYLLVLARMFGPELFGTLTFAHFWVLMLLPIAGFGTNRLLSQRIGADPQQAIQHLGDILGLRILSIATVTILSFIATLFWPEDENTQALLFIFSAALTVRSLAGWIDHTFIALYASHTVFRLELVFRSIEVTIGLIAIINGASIIWIALIHLCSWLAQVIYAWQLLRKRLGLIRPRWQRDRLPELAASGIAIMLTTFGITSMETSGLVVLRSFAIEPQVLGQVGLLLQMLMVALLAPKSFAVAALPVLSSQAANIKTLNQTTAPLLLRASIIGSSAIALFTEVLAPWLLPPLVGHDYLPVINDIGRAMWLLLPLSVGNILTQLSIANGHFALTARHALAGALVTVLSLLLLFQLMPLSLVVVAMALGSSLWCLLQAIHAHQQKWLKLSETFTRPLLAITMSLLVFYSLRENSLALALFLGLVLLLPGLGPIKSLSARTRNLASKLLKSRQQRR